MHHLLPSLKFSGYNLQTLGHGLGVFFLLNLNFTKRHLLIEPYSMTVVNSLCIVLLCCVFSTGIDLVSLQ